MRVDRFPGARALRAVAVVLLGLAGVFSWTALSRAAGCDVSWASAVSGNWTDGSKWSGGSVPTSSQNACITVSGSYTVTLTGSQQVGSLTLAGGSGGPTLVISASQAIGGATLTLNGNSANTGTIELTDPDSSGSSATAKILIETGATLTNGGTIRSDPGPAGLGQRIIDGHGTNSGTLLNASGGTIAVNQDLQVDEASRECSPPRERSRSPRARHCLTPRMAVPPAGTRLWSRRR